MSTNRHPAGTTVGGQWAPGASGEVDIDLDDALDDTFDDDPFEDISDEEVRDPAETVEYAIADDGGFDFGLSDSRRRLDRSLNVSATQTATLEPGDLALVERKDGGDIYVLAGTRGMAVLEPDGDDEDRDYSLTTLEPTYTGSQSPFLPSGVERVSDSRFDVADDEFLPSGEIENYGKLRTWDSVRRLMSERTNIGAPTIAGERDWCQSVGSGPEYASHPLARQKAYDFIATNPDVSLRPQPDWRSGDNDMTDDWDDFDGLAPEHRNQVFARRFIPGGAEEHFYADGPEIFCHRWPENTNERIDL